MGGFFNLKEKLKVKGGSALEGFAIPEVFGNSCLLVLIPSRNHFSGLIQHLDEPPHLRSNNLTPIPYLRIVFKSVHLAVIRTASQRLARIQKIMILLLDQDLDTRNKRAGWF